MMDKEYTQNGWNEYKLLVVDSLEGLKEKHDNLDKKIDERTRAIEAKIEERTRAIEDKVDLKVGEVREKLEKLHLDFTILKTKAIVYGGLAGFVIALLLQFLFTLFKLK